MKIGIYAPFYKPFEGGAERVAERIAREFSRQHNVTVFTLQFQPDLAMREYDGHVLIRRAPYHQSQPLGFTRLRSPALIDMLRGVDLDILHIHGVTFPNLALNVLRTMRSRSVPTVLVPHGLFEAYYGDSKARLPRQTIYALTVRPLLAGLVWNSSHVALTSIQERRLLRKFAFPRKYTTLVYNGFEPPRTSTASAERFRQRFGMGSSCIVLHVGTVKPNKGHDVMLQTLPSVTQRHPNLHYVSVGRIDGLWHDFARTLKESIHRVGIEDHVTLLGHLPDEDLADAYSAADIVVVPSLAETFPLTVLDGMAWGKPVIASRVGGVAEMFTDRQSGLLVPPGNTKAMAEALERLLANPEERVRMGAAAQREVTSRFDWKQVLARYEAVSERLLITTTSRVR